MYSITIEVAKGSTKAKKSTAAANGSQITTPEKKRSLIQTKSEETKDENLDAVEEEKLTKKEPTSSRRMPLSRNIHRLERSWVS